MVHPRDSPSQWEFGALGNWFLHFCHHVSPSPSGEMSDRGGDDDQGNGEGALSTEDAGGLKRRLVRQACYHCRESHLSCTEGARNGGKWDEVGVCAEPVPSLEKPCQRW